MRTRRELEGQGNDVPPRVAPGAEPPGQRAHRENGDGERAVLAIARDDGASELIGIDGRRCFSVSAPNGRGEGWGEVRENSRCDTSRNPPPSGAHGRGEFLLRPRHRAEGRPAPRRRAEIAQAENCSESHIDYQLDLSTS